MSAQPNKINKFPKPCILCNDTGIFEGKLHGHKWTCECVKQKSNYVPAALVNLKTYCGQNNWIIIRDILVKYLNFKRSITRSNLDDKTKSFCEQLYYQEQLEVFKDWESIGLENMFEPPDDINKMSPEVIISHLKNVLSTLKKTKYNSYILGYIQDSILPPDVKSGNTKYINC